MNLKISEELENSIENIAKNNGFDIEYIEFVKEANGNVFRIVLDKENGVVSVDDCELISKEVEDIVDKKISDEYVLEVSSPGLERQLKNIRLYKKYIGKEIYFKMYKKQEFGKEIVATLKNVDEEEKSIVVDYLEKEYKIKIDDIASAHTTYDFSKVLKDDDGVNINELKKF